MRISSLSLVKSSEIDIVNVKCKMKKLSMENRHLLHVDPVTKALVPNEIDDGHGHEDQQSDRIKITTFQYHVFFYISKLKIS